MRKITLFAPIILGVSFILAHFLHNIGELTAVSLIVPITGTLIFAGLIFLLFKFIFKDEQRSVSFTCIFLIFFFFYGQMSSFVSSISPFKSFVQTDVWLFPLWLVALFSVFKKVQTSKRAISLNQYFLLISTIVLLFTSVQILSYLFHRPSHSSNAGLTKISLPKVSQKSFPDIYYIVPDSYSASKSLQKYYKFDNSAFENFLTDRNFYVATSAASNYPKTFVSLGSSLNMQYLDFLSTNRNSSDLTLVDSMISNNVVVNYLKRIGYKYYHLGSWWGATHQNKLADKNFLLEDEKVGIGTFNFVILESTALNPFLKFGFFNLTLGNSEDDQRNRILFQFDKLTEVSKLAGPKFVFVHIISPHEPYVFDQNCNNISFTQTLKYAEEENYIYQVNCINQKLQAAVDVVIKRNKRPAVIIVQSDEGAPFLAERLNPPDSWGAASTDLLREKFPVFEAIRLPNIATGSSGLYPSISPVNLFRAIFNDYFKTNLPILEDKHYIFPNMKDLYNFQEITPKLQ